MRATKKIGFSDRKISQITGVDEKKIRTLRENEGIIPAYKMVDTCAAEFEAKTPYYYGCYEEEDEVMVSDDKK
jgi:carbamoyl-phosphate synthase large subunit